MEDISSAPSVGAINLLQALFCIDQTFSNKRRFGSSFGLEPSLCGLMKSNDVEISALKETTTQSRCGNKRAAETWGGTTGAAQPPNACEI